MIIYCGHLGLIELSYCLNMNEGLPCKNIIGCWHRRIDIVKILKERFTVEELNMALNSVPSSRLEKIIEAMKK